MWLQGKYLTSYKPQHPYIQNGQLKCTFQNWGKDQIGTMLGRIKGGWNCCCFFLLFLIDLWYVCLPLLAALQEESINFLWKSRASKYFRFYGLYCLCWNYSTQPVQDKDFHTQHINKWPCLCFSKTFLTKAGCRRNSVCRLPIPCPRTSL